MNVRLKRVAYCRECGRRLERGEVARYYGRGRVFCRVHPIPRRPEPQRLERSPNYISASEIPTVPPEVRT
jgi:hypothetical protein